MAAPILDASIAHDRGFVLSLLLPCPSRRTSAQDYPDYYLVLDRVFGLIGLKPRVAVDATLPESLFTATKRGAMIALSTLVFKQVTGKARLSVFDEKKPEVTSPAHILLRHDVSRSALMAPVLVACGRRRAVGLLP
ncbi:MAG: hypothetical protein WA376_06275 [Terrimicrobiaceae bacterium]